MIQFRVVGYRIADVRRAQGMDVTNCATIEGMRKYQLNHIYPHIPDEVGVEYLQVEVPGTELSDEVKERFRSSGFTKLDVFMRAEVHNCPYCNRGQVIND